MVYVTSRYPAVSHTFILREVLALRAGGTDVETVSVRRADPGDLLATADREEAERTWDILPLDRRAFVGAHLRAAWRAPGRLRPGPGRGGRVGPPGLERASCGSCFTLPRPFTSGTTPTRPRPATCMPTWPTWPPTSAGWPARSAGRRSPRQGWAWSFTMHGPTELYSTERFNLARKVERADGVICISEYTRSQLMYLTGTDHWAKLRVVHCGTDLARYQYRPPPPPGGGLSVLCVARLAPQKGLDVLVSAIGALVEGGTDVHLTIVGSGPLEASLRRSAERRGVAQRVSFAGAVGQDDMADYYARADIFCLPSFAEGLPIVLMEAMATGRPVVATRVMGVPELVEDGVSGLLVAPGNVDELAGALGKLAGSPGLRESFGRAGRAQSGAGFRRRRAAPPRWPRSSTRWPPAARRRAVGRR